VVKYITSAVKIAVSVAKCVVKSAISCDYLFWRNRRRESCVVNVS